jgi:hypothetical protein
MRSEIGRLVRKSFSSKMRELLPQFLEEKPSGALLGGLLYRWQATKNLNCFVYLQVSQKMYHECFMVELSCSPVEFPLDRVAFDPNDTTGGRVRFRLPELYREEWREKSRRVPWWWIGPEILPGEIASRATARALSGSLLDKDEGLLPIEQALPLVEPQVADAVDRVKRFGIPFFQDFAKGHGDSL